MSRPGRDATTVLVAHSTAGRRCHEGVLSERITAIHASISQALDGETNIGVLSRLASGDLVGAVAALTAWCMTRCAANAGAHGASAEDLRDMLTQLQRLGSETAEHDLGRHARRLGDTSAALRRLRGVASSTQLVDEVCGLLVARCGFGRAVLSRVDGQSWRPWVAHFSGAAADAAWFAEWVDRSIPLDDRLLETRLVGERQPAAVYDTRDAPVYRPIIVDAGRSSSYVVAPVVLGDEVVGLVHADHSPSARRVDSVDRDVLWTFTQGFSLAYEHLVLAEQVHVQRDRLRKALAAAETIVDTPGTSPDLAVPGSGTEPLRRLHEVANLGQSVGTSRGAGPALLEELTDRETQVLELLALGATNAQIADELVVSECTVKSHVRHILRKLGAVNRTQAISRFLGIGSLGSEPLEMGPVGMRQPALR